MKVSELRPCDQCGKPNGMMFYRVQFELAIVRRTAVEQYLGMNAFFGGRAGSALIENFAPEANDAVRFAGDEDANLRTEAFICQNCFMDGEVDLPMLMEKINAKRERSAELEGSAAAEQDTEKEG